MTYTEATDALDVAKEARFDATTGVSTKSTGVLTAEAADAATATAAAKAAATAVPGGAAAVAAYDSAVAGKTAADAAVEANAVAAAAATAGLDKALKADGAAVDYTDLSDAAGKALSTTAEILTFLADSTSNPLLRAAVVTELNKVATYGADVVKEGNLELAAAKADEALAKATTDLQKIDSDDTGTKQEGQDYIDAKDAQTGADKKLADAKAADEKVAAIQSIVDKFASLDKSVADAQAALDKFQTDNATKIAFHDIAAGTVTGDAKSDVFYFADKATGADDLVVNSFAAGDSIVLGSSFTQGSSVAAGDSNKLEFFLVQGSAGVNVIVEGVAHANASTTVDASGNVTAHTDAAVITLTGVSLADLTVSNGVISHVA